MMDRIDEAAERIARYVEVVFPWCEREIESRWQAAAGMLMAAALGPFLVAAGLAWWIGAFWRYVVLGKGK
jgi:hypothetical protein